MVDRGTNPLDSRNSLIRNYRHMPDDELLSIRKDYKEYQREPFYVRILERILGVFDHEEFPTREMYEVASRVLDERGRQLII